MSSGTSVVPPAFAGSCEVRPLEIHHLAATLQLASGAHVVCFEFENADSAGLKCVADTKIGFPSVPILMLTLQHSTDIVLWAMRARIFDVLLKPVTDDEVQRCLARLLPILEARRTQSSRQIAATHVQLPSETRYRTNNVQKKLQGVIAHISKNYAQAISEEQMAALCGLTPCRFSREFSAAFGVTFRDYVCGVRLAHAKRLLRNPEIPVTDVAAISGFNDPSYFARAFRKHTGTVPTLYRKQALLGGAATDPDDEDLDAAVGSR